MTHFQVRTPQGEPIDIEAKAGAALYVLGANGSGKSTLMFEWAKGLPSATLVSGNRQVTFQSAAVTYSPHEMNQSLESADQYRRIESSRYSRNPLNDEQFLSTLLARLKERGDHAYREYFQLDRAGETEAKDKLSTSLPDSRINAALAACQLPIALRWNDRSELTVTKRGVAVEYGIDKMSDGERAALILAMSSVLADRDTAILVDEPERHLHRSISSPLLEFLRKDRPDLSWVVATHDLSLVRDDPTASVLLLYEFDGQTWKAEVPPDPADLSPEIADAIYGARERVLFVEGRDTSLDRPLYNLFFPGVTIVGAGTCRDVQNAVVGLRRAPGIHHMMPAGLVDADNRVDLGRLQRDGVRALGLYAVESLYYRSEVVDAVLKVAGTEASLREVISAGCDSVTDDDLQRFARDASYKSFRHAYLSRLPSVADFESFAGQVDLMPDEDFDRSIAVLTRLCALRDNGSWDELVAAVKLKSCSATKIIAGKLKYASPGAYELAARKVLKERPEILVSLGQLVPNPFS
jgi:ABC-type cobalamin/Fe3+-siderophores transport system ATPase subunit